MEFKPQLALHKFKELEKKRTKVREDTFAIFEKYDGWYGVKRVDFTTSNVQPILSRKMREIPALRDFSALMKGNEITNDITFNGHLIFEILIKGKPLFSDLNGILNRSKDPCQADNAYIMVHDYVPVGGENIPFLERYKLAQAYVKSLKMANVMIAPILALGKVDDIQKIAEMVWATDRQHLSNEGAIGKIVNAPYECGKRNKNILKVKCEVTLELLVTAIVEGEGKYSGTLGAIVCKDKAGNVHNLSGMSDEQRNEWYANPNLIVGKVIEAEAMQVLPNGSLREGRFKAVRHDKDTSEID